MRIDQHHQQHFYFQDLLLEAVRNNDLLRVKDIILQSRISMVNVRMKDGSQNTLLHEAVLAYREQKSEAARQRNLDLGHFLLEIGCEFNSVNREGLTPLHYACLYGLKEWMYVLSCYSHWNCTLNLPMRLRTLINAMRSDAAHRVCYKNLENTTSKIIYDRRDFDYLLKSLRFLKPECFKIFAGKHEKIIEEFLRHGDILNNSLKIVVCRTENVVSHAHVKCCKNTLGVLKALLSFKHFAKILVENKLYEESTIYYLTYLFEILKKSSTDLRILVEHLLWYGLNVTSEDFEIVFSCYGCCPLFKTFLRMKLTLTHDFQTIMPFLYLDLNQNFNDFYKENQCIIHLLDPKLVEKYFAGRRVKKLTKFEQVETVPKLMELCRNAARRYLVEKYRIEDVTTFYKRLENMSIGDTYRKILTYETPVYFN